MAESELIELQKLAGESLAKNPYRHLELHYRKKIWMFLGPLQRDGAKAVFGVGLMRRTLLAIQCVQKVLPIWQKSFPDDQSPKSMIATAKKYLEKGIGFEDAWKMKNQFWGKLENLVSEGHDLIPLAAGFCAANALKTAINDELFKPDGSDQDLKDGDLDMWQWDASYYGSVAYSGGAPEEDGNPELRYEFWSWYIDVALMRASESAFE